MADIGRWNGHANSVQPNRHPAAISEVDEFCNALGGNRPIHSILIANNGMAAVKFIRSVRSWANETFGTEKAILLVAMATPEDMRINAEHIRIADQFVEVPGGTNNNNYANVQLIVEVCDVDFMRFYNSTCQAYFVNESKKRQSTDGNYTWPCIFHFSDFLKVINLNVIYKEHNAIDLPDIKYSFYKNSYCTICSCCWILSCCL